MGGGRNSRDAGSEPPRASDAPVDYEALANAAAATWPSLGLDAAAFTAHVRGLGTAIVIPAATRNAADLFLACACLAHLPKALDAFESSYLKRVPEFIARIGNDRDFVQEVTQTLRARLLVADPPDRPRIASYSARAPLLSWVAVCAQRVALDHRRRGTDHGTSSAAARAPSPADDPETAYFKLRYGRVFEDSIATAVARLPPREKVLLRLWLYESLSMDRIAAMYSVNVSTVSRWLAKAREALGADVEALVREELRVSGSELESLTRLIRSQFDETVLRDLLRSR